MSKVAGFVIGAIEVGVGIATDNPMLIVQGSLTIVSQAVVDLTAAKQPARQASEMTIQLGEQARVLLLGETFTPGSLVDGFNYGGTYGTDWEVLIIRLADHKCHSLTGFFVNDQYFLYTADGLVPAFDDQLEIYFRADTTSTPLPAIVTTNGPGWKSTDIGASGCDVIVAYKADKANDKHPGWPGGRPRFGFVVKGAYCYDPRLDSTVSGGSGPHRDNDPSTWEWSENAAICRYKWVRGVYANDVTSDQTALLVGRGLTASEAPPENIIAPANACDEQTPLVYPTKWVETTVAFNPTSLSPDGMTLYTQSSGVLGAVDLATRSQVLGFSVPGAGGGQSLAATNSGVYFLDSAGNLFLASRGGTVSEVLTQPASGLFPGGIGYAGGDIWLYPQSFSPNAIGQLDLAGGGYSLTSVGYNTTQVFTAIGGTAMAVGTTSGHVLVIGPAGAAGTALDTTAYGTSGDVWAFDAGATWVALQGDHLFQISKGGTPAIVAAVTVSALLRQYEAFAAITPGAASFWVDGHEYASADLSLIRTVDLTAFTGAMGGTPGGGILYDPINNALMVTTSGALGLAFLLLDRNGSYRVAGPIYSTQQFIDVEGMFASATAGNTVTHEGSVELEPGQANSVVAAFTDSDLLSASKVSWNNGFLSQANQEWVNTVVPKYVEPDQKWNDHEAPPARVNADIVADGQPREAQLALRLVRYPTQAQRVAEIIRRLGRLWGRATVTLGPRFCELEEGDWVQWQSDRLFGGATKTFRVDAVAIDIKWHVTLTLREISADVYAIDGSFPVDYSRPIMSPLPRDIGTPAPANWSLAAITLDSPGASVPALEITGSAADDPYAEAIIFEYWKDDGVSNPTADPDAIPWISAGRDSPDTTKVDVTSISGGATYYGAVSYVVGGVTGDRLVLGPVTVSGLTTTTLRTADTTTITADDITHSADLA